MADSVDNPWILSVFDKLVEATDARSAHSRRRKSYIYRVPPVIRTLKPDRYACLILPLGLYYRDFTKVVPTETDQLKLEVVSVFLEDLNLKDSDGWKTFCSQVAEPPPEAPALENLYFDPPSDSFIHPEVVQSVLTIDAVFIAVFIAAVYDDFYSRRLGEAISCDDDDEDYEALEDDLANIFRREDVRCNVDAYLTDMWSIFENQIPLFLIKNVFKIITRERRDFLFDDFLRGIVFDHLLFVGLPHAESEESDISFASCDHLLACLHAVVCKGRHSNPSSSSLKISYFEHCYELRILTNMLIRLMSVLLRAFAIVAKLVMVFPRWLLCCQTNTPVLGDQSERTLPTVSQLYTVGIRVKGIQRGACDIQFVRSWFNLRATLYLPEISFHDFTERYLLNMCAYELMTSDWNPLGAYLSVMDELISSEEDVRLMSRGDEPVIPTNQLGEDKMVADVINNLLQHFSLQLDSSDFEHLKGVRNEIHAWYGTRWRHQLNHFIDRFVKAPWIFVTMVVATLLLIATILQTVYTALGFYRTGP